LFLFVLINGPAIYFSTVLFFIILAYKGLEGPFIGTNVCIHTYTYVDGRTSAAAIGGAGAPVVNRQIAQVSHGHSVDWLEVFSFPFFQNLWHLNIVCLCLAERIGEQTALP
jgi:hypothetical protein